MAKYRYESFMDSLIEFKIEDRPSSRQRDFRFVLQDALTKRCARNTNFSLRSFAKVLDVSPSALSAMLNGKRPITHKMKERLGMRLGLNLSELKKLKSKAHGNSKKDDDPEISERFKQLTEDTFIVVSEPYHYALLELIKTQDFRWDSKWIAHRLQMTVSEVNFAIARLERVALLRRSESGELQDSTNGFSTDIREGLTTQAQRRFQVRALEKSIDSVETVPVQLRDNTSMTMAINRKDLTQAKEAIKKFRRKFCRDLESNPTLNEVYQLTVAFVPLTNSSGEKK